MVFFTCNHCGEAVKKPAVEKHYSTKCRNAPKSISCMDCQKDFQDNYVEHTKCITEMQKYSGKDYVPRESQNSGAKKQEGWVEVVRSVLDTEEYKLSTETRNAFLTLQNYDNIPRKKPKFLNFVTNSVRLPRRIVEEVWNILEKEQEKMKQARQAQHKVNSKGKENVGGEKEDASKATVTDIDNDKSKEAIVDTAENGLANESKKKKKKHKEIAIENENEKKSVVEDKLINGNNENENGKKKKKKQNTVEETESVEVVQQKGHSEDSKKHKKKLKSETEITESNDAAEPPSKKQKKNNANENGLSSEQTQCKKKKHNELMENGIITDEPAKKKHKTVETNNTTQQNSTDTYQFCWDTELARIIDKYPDGLTMEKLKKKLFKKFKTKFAESELTERQEKGFEKKLNKKVTKCGKLQLNGDLVKPCS